MKLLKLGQRFYREPDSFEERIKDIYKVLSLKDMDTYKVLHISTHDPEKVSMEIVNRSIVDEGNIKIAPWHYKIKIQFVTLVDGTNDITLSLYDDAEASIPLYYTTVIRGITKTFPLYIVASMKETYEEYFELVKSLSGDIKYIDSEYEFVGYIDDSIDNLISMISLNQRVYSGIYDLLVANSSEELLGSKDEVIKNFLDEYCKYSDCFRRIFGIYKFPFTLTGKNELNAGDRFMVEAAIQDNMIDYIIVQYYLDINLDRIQNKFAFLEDADGKLFILNYHGKSELPGIV